MSAARPKGASAVMAQKKPRKLSSGEAWEKLELFPTPPWATRAFFEHVAPRVSFEPIGAVWEPCAGLGHMAAAIVDYCPDLDQSDVHIYDLAGGGSTRDIGVRQADFLDSATAFRPRGGRFWIVTNPPFSAAADMLERALAMPDCDGVAFLLRLQWLSTETRYRRVMLRHRPSLVAHFVERVPMCLGGYDLKGSTATDCAWFVWRREYGGEWYDPPLSPGAFYSCMIPPCREALTRAGDRLLALRSVPGFVPPSARKTRFDEQAELE